MFRLVVSLAFVAFVSGGVIDAPKRWLPDTYIFGGHEAADGQFPYQVSLRNNSGSHFCGGAIIHPDWVLSVAHCTALVGNNPGSIYVVAGSNSLSSGGIAIRPSRIITHENYNANKISNDVALIKLDTSLPISSTIAPIALTYVNSESGVDAVLSGFGSVRLGHANPDRLQFLNTEILSHDDCYAQVGAFGLNEDNICNQGTYKKGICAGDSGSPLVTNTGLVGVVSFLYSACGSGYPDGFASVYYHRNWIRDNSGV